jgi:hypothetical protein
MSKKESQGTEADYAKIREEHGQLSEQLIQGPRYSEPVRVHCTDGKEHDVPVFALSTSEIQTLFKDAGVDLNDLGNREKLLENMAFMTMAAERATKDPKISEVLVGLEPSKIALKMFELSGLTGAPKASSTAT